MGGDRALLVGGDAPGQVAGSCEGSAVVQSLLWGVSWGYWGEFFAGSEGVRGVKRVDGNETWATQ